MASIGDHTRSSTIFGRNFSLSTVYRQLYSESIDILYRSNYFRRRSPPDLFLFLQDYSTRALCNDSKSKSLSIWRRDAASITLMLETSMPGLRHLSPKKLNLQMKNLDGLYLNQELKGQGILISILTSLRLSVLLWKSPRIGLHCNTGLG